MRRLGCAAVGVLLAGGLVVTPPAAAETAPTGPGRVGAICSTSPASQPAEFAGNFLLTCSGLHRSLGGHWETTIAVNPTDAGNVITGSIFDFDTRNHREREVINAYVTKDAGATWTTVRIPRGGYFGLSDPSVAFDAEGRAFFADHTTGERHDVVVSYSDDGGLSWTGPITVETEAEMMSENYKPWVVVDTNTSSPFLGDVYVVWLAGAVFFSRSSDRGLSWSEPVEISGSSRDFCFVQVDPSVAKNRCDPDVSPQPVVTPNGQIVVAFLNWQSDPNLARSRDRVLVVRSADGGLTWRRPVAVTGLVHDGAIDLPPPYSLSGCEPLWPGWAWGGLAVSSAPANAGELSYVFQQNTVPGNETSNLDVFVVSSTDGGRTWSSASPVDARPNDQFMAWPAYGADGRLRVGYLDRDRTGPAGESCVFGESLSTREAPGATGFTTVPLETGLSIASDCITWIPDTIDPGLCGWLGDYGTNLAVGPDGSVWAIWPDARQLVTDPAGNSAHIQQIVASVSL